MNYTSIEQSKKLLELGLSPESADMGYFYWERYKSKTSGIDDVPTILAGLSIEKCDIPCWTVGALLESVPKYFSELNHQFVQTISYDHIDGLYHFVYRDYQHGGRDKTIASNKDLLDGAFEMVVWLIKNGYTKTK